MKKKLANNELLRLAILTLLIAAMFGILQYFPKGETFDKIGIGVVLKVIASTMLKATFPIFAMYIILLGLNLRYEKKREYPKLQSFFYDLGIYFTTFIIILSILLYFFVWLLAKFPNFPMKLIVIIIWIVVIICAILIYKPIREYFRIFGFKVKNVLLNFLKIINNLFQRKNTNYLSLIFSTS